MTWLFKANRADYMEIFGRNLCEKCDDKSLRDMEICIWMGLQKARADVGCFHTYPDIEGNMGETTVPYTKSQVERVIRSIMAKMGIFTMNSLTSKCFWKLYGSITGRKAYVTVDEIEK